VTASARTIDARRFMLRTGKPTSSRRPRLHRE
jgi:hypothetical protein